MNESCFKMAEPPTGVNTKPVSQTYFHLLMVRIH